MKNAPITLRLRSDVISQVYLPLNGNVIGDTRKVLDTGLLYAWISNCKRGNLSAWKQITKDNTGSFIFDEELGVFLVEK